MNFAEDEVRRMAGAWLAKAMTDVLVCEALDAQGGGFREVIALHARLAVEKALKALLVWHRIEIPQTHDLGELIDLIAARDAPLAESLGGAADLAPHGVEYGYPGEQAPVSEAAAAAAVAQAHRVIDEVGRRLSGDPGRL